MSQLGSTVGGKVGGDVAGTSVDQQQYPYFTSMGGVTPQQTALSDYDYGQNLLEGQAQFEGGGQGGGPSLSSMATQVATGANTGRALDLAKMSDVNQNAEYGSYKNAINIDQQNNENLLAENQAELQQSLTDAGNFGKLLGGQAAQQTPVGSST